MVLLFFNYSDKHKKLIIMLNYDIIKGEAIKFFYTLGGFTYGCQC